MADDALSLQHRKQAAQAMRRRLLITLGVALVLIGGGWITLWAAGGTVVAPAPRAPAASAASRRPSDELLETAKGLQVTQQQAVDQLQVVQDQIVAQRAETKKLSDQIAALTERTRRLATIDRQHAGRHDPRGRAVIRGAAETTLRPVSVGCPLRSQ